MDENLKQYATDTQWTYYQAVQECGSIKGASEKLGRDGSTISKSLSAMRAKAARHGYAPDHDIVHPAPPGFRVKGTSTLVDMATGEAKIRWVKTTADEVAQEVAMLAAIEGFKDEIPTSIPVKPPEETSENLISVYPVGDHHFGMLAWGDETAGEDYELTRGEFLLCGAMDHLVQTSPASQQAAILILGDFMHYDGLAPVTPTHGHLLDADSRFPKMVRVAIRSIRYLINAALAKHEQVKLIVEIGNHDLSSAIFLMETFAALYENDPRVVVDNSPRNIHCFQFGKNMIGTHHGHKIKMDALPMLFANDWPIEWGCTKYRYFHTGHVHHDNVKEVVGAVIESHRILAPADAHSSSSGYRSLQSMKAIIYHAEYGEVSRLTVNPSMLDAA